MCHKNNKLGKIDYAQIKILIANKTVAVIGGFRTEQNDNCLDQRRNNSLHIACV